MGYQDNQTRKILNLIREGDVKSKKQMIKEQLDPTLNPTDQMDPDSGFEIADMPDENEEISGEVRELDTDELKEEEDKFRQTVHNRVEFNKFKLYPKSQNVEFGGKFTDSRIEWFYSLDDSTGVYITTDMLQLRDETLEVIKKLVGYYKAWSDEWANRIAEEYNTSISNEDVEEVEEVEGIGFEPGDDLPDEDDTFA
jgi:hypothetical protein|tara:strand:+ start:656 stop:1246 length:591 start_codon:yes stop_codon:yes gene_type:complete